MGVQENNSEELSYTFYTKIYFGKGDSPLFSFSLKQSNWKYRTVIIHLIFQLLDSRIRTKLLKKKSRLTHFLTSIVTFTSPS